VSAVGGVAFEQEAWRVDVAVTASQKCLMSAPGLSFVSLSERAWDVHGRSSLPRRYWDFSEIRASVTAAKPSTPGTPPVTVMRQVADALRMIEEEGLPAVQARHAAMAARLREGTARLGLSLQVPGFTRFAPTVTAIASPSGRRPSDIRDGLRRRGILVAGALGPFDGHGFRIGHMGDIRMADVERTLDALADVMRELDGRHVTPSEAGTRR
jgi:aspartate aminotransferase-like enzyme